MRLFVAVLVVLALTACSSGPMEPVATYSGPLGEHTAHLRLDPPVVWVDELGTAADVRVWAADSHLLASFWLKTTEYRLRLVLDDAGCYEGTWGTLNPTWDPERGATTLCPG